MDKDIGTFTPVLKWHSLKTYRGRGSINPPIMDIGKNGSVISFMLLPTLLWGIKISVSIK
jgi:hypothetical protein